VTALVALICLLPQAEEEVTLRVKPRNGSTYTYSTVSTVTSKVPGLTGTPSESLTKATMKVVESNDKQVRFETTINDIKAEGGSNLKGSKLLYTMTPLGELTDISGTGGGEVLPVIAAGLKGSLKLTPRFAERAVKVGDSWETEVDLAPVFASAFGTSTALKGDTKTNLTCTLEALPREGRARFAVIKYLLSKQVTVAFGTNEVVLLWNLEGTTRYEVGTGMIVKQDSIQTQTFTRPGESAPMMTVSIVSKINLEPK